MALTLSELFSYSPGSAKVGIESWQVVDSGGLVVAEDDAVGSLEQLLSNLRKI